MNAKRIVLTSLLVVTAMITFAALASSSYDKNAFARVCYKYTPPTHGTPPNTYRKKLITCGQFNSIVQSEFTNTANWTSVAAGTPPSGCNAGSYVCAICFTDGATGRTLQQALDYAWAYYILNNCDFACNTDIDPSSEEVTVYCKSTDAN